MAAGSVTAAALRHRPRQALLVLVLAAVVTASAALGPLYARAVEESVVRTVVSAAPVQARTLVVTDASPEPAAPARLDRLVRPVLPDAFGAPVGGAEAPVVLRSGDDRRARARLTSRSGLCGHVEVVDGRCVRALDEALVSRRAAGVLGLHRGSLLTVGDGDAVEVTVTVVGLYGPVDASAPYWAGRAQPPTDTRPGTDEQAVPRVDDVLTGWATLAGARFPDLRTHLDVPLRAPRLTLRDLPDLRATTQAVDARVRTVGASATSRLGSLLDSTDAQRDQARTVVPLLAVQLAVLGIVVLVFVCAAVTEQRRPEIALARLRGHGAVGAAGMLLRELGVLVVLGGAVGTGLGWLVAEGAALAWLEPGVRPELRAPVVLAVLASVAAGLLAILAAGAPTLRQPLAALLRRVPPRASALQVGLAEGTVAAAAVAGLVTLLSGGDGGIALLAPGLLAIAGGLLLAQAVIPVAGPLARRALRGGRVPWALAGLQISRRPALRRLIAIVTVACALLVFAVDAWAVSGRNRDTRAAVEAGAPVVLTVDADSSLALRSALLDIDPAGRFATPVVTVSSATAAGPRTTAIEPAAFARIARWGADRPSAGQLAAISPPRPGPVRFRGERVTVDATFAVRGVVADGPPPALEDPFGLALGVVDQAGTLRPVDMGPLRAGRGSYSAAVDCAQGCSLQRVTVTRTFGDFVDARVDLTVTRARAGRGDALTEVDLDTGAPGHWQPLPWRPSIGDDGTVVRTGDALHVSGTSFGTPVSVQHAHHPVHPVALRAGNVSRVLDGRPGRGVLVTAPDLRAGDAAFAVDSRIRQVPRSGGRGVLVDLAALAGGPSAAPGLTTYDVWLAADEPVREARLRADLAGHGLQVLARDSAQAHGEALAGEGPALALRLALLAGVVAVLLAAAVLVVGVATSGASRARDLAGLRLVGVPATTVRRASVREHLVVAVLGVLAGAGLGLVAAQAVLPEIPLFAEPSRLVRPVLAPAWTAVLASTAGCLVLLTVVSVVVGGALAASAVPARLREGR